MAFDLIKRRPLAVLLPLLIGHLALFSVQVKDKEGTTLLKHSTFQFLSPFLRTGHAVGAFWGAFWSEYVQLREVRNENEELRERIAHLTLQVQERDAQLGQVRRTQGWEDFRARQPFKTRKASVIGRSPTFLSFSILLDCGASDGVKKDDPVITLEGVVGRVIDVHAQTCEVQVLADADAAAGALIARTRMQGVLNGRGSLLYKLNYLLNQEDVQVGDLVVTSGLDGVYPKDLPLGRVFRVAPGENVFKEIEVFPAVNFSRLEEVLIVLDKPPAS